MYCISSVNRNFRNLKPQRLEWSMGLNLLIGENGSGKTNTLETLHLLTGWGPFRSLRKSSLVNWNQPSEQTLMKGFFAGEEHIEIYTAMGSSNLISCDGKRSNFSTVRSRIPALAFLPGDLSLIDGSPSGRRRYMDRICALIFPLYARRLNDCKRALKHRTVLLKQGRDTGVTSKVLAPLVSWIWSSRITAMDLVCVGLSSFPDLLPGKLELKHIRGGSVGVEDPLQDFWESIELRRKEEQKYRTPLVGPQRDDIIMTCGDKNASEKFSRGHRRRASVALMLAAAWAVERRLRRKPILILDEIAAELDERGREVMVKSLSGCSWQVFAATAENNIKNWPGVVWEVKNGRIEKRTIPDPGGKI